jgi:hypothetical protein
MPTGYEGPLAEFSALRQEIDARNGNQHQILSLQLLTAGGIFGLVIKDREFVPLLILVPFTSYLLCGRCVTQGHAVERIAQYIRRRLSPQVPGGLGWEKWHRARRRRDYRWSWFVPLLLSFPGASLLAIGACGFAVALMHDKAFTKEPARYFLIAACVLAVVPLVGSVVQLSRLRRLLDGRNARQTGPPWRVVVWVRAPRWFGAGARR